MAIVISGVNNNDKITASDGTIDLLSGVNFNSELTVPSFKVGSNIQLGNVGIITATTFTGNVTGNINNSTLLLQTGGYERLRIDSSGRVLIGTTTEGFAEADDLTINSADHGGVTIRTPTNKEGNIAFSDTTSGTGEYSGLIRYRHSSNDLGLWTNSLLRLLIDSSGRVMIGTTTEGEVNADDLTIATSGNTGITIRSGGTHNGVIQFSDGTSGTNEYAGFIDYDHNIDLLKFGTASTERLRIESAGNVKVSKNLSVTGIATVGSAVTISESGIEASGIGITCANINGGKIGGRRNLIINGAMVINQRNASTTTDNGYGCDRWRLHFGNTDEAPTLSQADVASGTEPYNIGLRKSLKLTNGNQTSGAEQFDYMWIRYRGEAQDIVTSGWNYTSSTSFLTLSFYIKSSVAQNFYGYLKDVDGSPDRAFPFETGSLTADTWKRVSVLIPGDSGLQFDNNSGRGFELFWGAFVGTYYSSNSSSVNTWKNYTDNDRVPDSTTTWYTTNDATLEITGVQLELGTEATAFEHRTFAEDYRDCLRYYYESRQDGNNFTGNGPNSYASGYFGFGLNGNRVHAGVRFPVPMRGIPSVTIVQPSDGAANGIHRFRGVSGSNSAVDTALSNVSVVDIGNFGFLYFSASSGITQGAGYLFHIIANAEI